MLCVHCIRAILERTEEDLTDESRRMTVLTRANAAVTVVDGEAVCLDHAIEAIS